MVQNEKYESSDNPDLTPTQIANFYRDLHGNYDQLFLGTPHESIAFIYKSLGCLHSLQPQSFTHSTAFTDPTVPALKTEGWTMWQTIQLLLGPEEHAGFLMEAVQKWDVKDPATGDVFPKILPRSCFPTEPDRHMVAWYEGVSERLRREAEDENRRREVEAEQAETRRLRERGRGEEGATDNEGSVDSKGPALAYFRNPLYRHVDGRPSIVRKNSNRPALSPRPTMRNKSKEAATTMGHVIRNIGSPSLWNGRRGSRSASRDTERDKRRRSLPDHRHSRQHFPGDLPPPSTNGSYEASATGLSPNDPRHGRRRSGQAEQMLDLRPATAETADDEYDGDGPSPIYSPRPGSHNRHHHQRHSGGAESATSGLRHSKSHDPTPSQTDYGSDYFGGYDDPNRRRNSAQDSVGTPAAAPDGEASGAGVMGGGFGPSASPLFATHVARQPQPPPPHGPPPGMRPPTSDPYGPRKAPSVRRAQDRPFSRSPAGSERRPDTRNSGRYESPHRQPRARFEQSPHGRDYDDAPPPPPSESSRHWHTGHPGGRPPSRPMSMKSDMPPPAGIPGGAPYAAAGAPYPPSAQGQQDHHRRRSGRMSGSEYDANGPEDGGRRQGRPKQTRFANGVDGRRYVSPWG